MKKTSSSTELRASPEMIARAWDTWRSREPRWKLGPGPAFVEAINAAINDPEFRKLIDDSKSV